MDFQALIKDRKVQYAAGGGALLAVFVYVKKKASGTSTTATTTGASTTGTATSAIDPTTGLPYGPYDSSGTDAYNNFQGTLDQFASQISSIQSQLSTSNPPASTTPTPAKPPAPATPPKAAANPKGSVLLTPGLPGTYMSAPKGLTLTQLSKQTGISIANLRRINSTLTNYPTTKAIPTGQIIRTK